jgi:hypothetical protein
MADPTALSHTNVLARLTLEDILKYLARLVGVNYSDWDADELALAKRVVNEAMNESRNLAPGARRFGEQQKLYDAWTADDTTIEVPADFAEWIAMYRVDSTDTDSVEAEIYLVPEERFRNMTIEGQNPYDEAHYPIARLWMESTSYKRMIRIYPTPSAGDRFLLLYHSLIEELQDTSDVLEAPPAFQEVVKYLAAVKWLLPLGDDPAIARYERQIAIQTDRLQNPARREVKKPARAEFFEDVSGYPGTRVGRPKTDLWPDTPLERND